MVYCVKCRRMITSGMYATTRQGYFHYPRCPRPSYATPYPVSHPPQTDYDVNGPSILQTALDIANEIQSNIPDNTPEPSTNDFESGGGESGGGGASGEF